ncbi:MAG: hypothetical protein ACRD37_08760 [Candidatus Acidiferrales bacterium]
MVLGFKAVGACDKQPEVDQQSEASGREQQLTAISSRTTADGAAPDGGRNCRIARRGGMAYHYCPNVAGCN